MWLTKNSQSQGNPQLPTGKYIITVVKEVFMISGDIKDNYEYSRKYRLVFMKGGSNIFLIEYEAQ